MSTSKSIKNPNVATLGAVKPTTNYTRKPQRKETLL